MKDWNYENEQWTRLPAHLKHLPLFTRQFDFLSYVFRWGWAAFLAIFFRSYVRLKVIGDFKPIYKKHPKLLIISNHCCHLDAVSIASAIPFRHWLNLYIAAAKDFFFTNVFFTFFSAHCLGAIPIDRKDKKREAVNLCVNLLKDLERIWLIIFPEGTRSSDGKLQTFKKGISVFSEKANVPILFLYLDGNAKLWPKGRSFSKMGSMTMHIGPVYPAGHSIESINTDYIKWASSVVDHDL